jgi:hypothetical protein
VEMTAVTLYDEQLAEAAYEPAQGQYELVVSDQRDDDLTPFDLQQLSLAPLSTESKGQERRRPCDFVAIRLTGPDSPTTRGLVDTGAEVGIAMEDRIPLSERGSYKPTRLRLRLPFGELRQAKGWALLLCSFPSHPNRTV